MIIDFSVNGNFMGTVNEDNRSSNTIKFNVAGTDRIKLIEIIRDNETVYKIEPMKDSVQDEWIDKSTQAVQAKYYYLRVTQADGNRGWSSPVWL